MEIVEHKIMNPSILSAKMDENIFTDLKNYVEQVISNKDHNKVFRRNQMKDRTVQGVGEAFSITNIPQNYKSHILDFSKEYLKYYNLQSSEKIKPNIDTIWINLQKRYEFRPTHAHDDGTGKNLSFVTYVKIPYDIEEENKYENHTPLAEVHRNGKIEFVLHKLDGTLIMSQFDISKKYEGVTIMFPNSFMHTVYPFYTSEDYRVSIAGNINFIQ